MAKIFLTGAAGFIGFHTAKALLARGDAIIGVDNLNDYYDPALKQARLAQLQAIPGFTFYRTDIADREAVGRLFKKHADVD
ncbi:MAG TPA: NAD-dependent epimerase/dehydratase family protein, partial [Alphaproteobacteria bacterium]